jgi:hypothetical protein
MKTDFKKLVPWLAGATIAGAIVYFSKRDLPIVLKDSFDFYRTKPGDKIQMKGTFSSTGSGGNRPSDEAWGIVTEADGYKLAHWVTGPRPSGVVEGSNIVVIGTHKVLKGGGYSIASGPLDLHYISAV